MIELTCDIDIIIIEYVNKKEEACVLLKEGDVKGIKFEVWVDRDYNKI